MTTTGSTVWSVLLRYLAGSILVIAVVLVLLFTLLPLGIRWAVSHWFAQQGVDAELKHLSIAPAVGRLELSGLSGSREGTPVFGLDELLLDVKLLPLLQQRLEVEDLRISGSFVQYQNRAGQPWIAGLDINGLQRQFGAADRTAIPATPITPAAPTAPTAPESENTGPWTLVVENFAIDRLKLCAQSLGGELNQPDQTDVAVSDYCVGWRQFYNDGSVNLKLAQVPDVMVPKLRLEGLRFSDRLSELSVVELANLELTGIEYNSSGAFLERLGLAQMQLLERQASSGYTAEQPDTLRLDGLELQQLQLPMAEGKPLGVDLNSLRLSGLDVFVHRDDHELLPVQRSINSMVTSLTALAPAADSAAQTSGTSETDTAAENSAQIPIKINAVVLDSGSRVLFVDEKIQPSVKQLIKDIQISAKVIETAVPDSKTDIRVSLGLNDFSEFELEGWIKPFSPKLNMALDAEVRSFDALSVSPYIERAMQYRVQRGLLSESLQLVIQEDQLDVDSELTLDKFYLESLQKEELQAGEKSQQLPVATAMNLLRDGDDRIFLKLPVSGDVADPSFSLGHVVGIVFRKALTQAVINYYTPFGLVNIASALADSATQLRFDPLLFMPGVNSIESSQQERLKQLAGLLEARPKLALSFCPLVTGADALAMLKLDKLPEGGLVLNAEQKNQLLAQGAERGRVVKQALLSASKVQVSQVIVCQPRLAIDKLDAPKVEIMI